MSLVRRGRVARSRPKRLFSACAQDDAGTLLLLAGLVFTMAFIVTASVTVQMSRMEAGQAWVVSPSPSGLASILREARVYLIEEVLRVTPMDVGAEAFEKEVVPKLSNALDAWEIDHGRVGSVTLARGWEARLHDATRYGAVSLDDARAYGQEFDGTDDGVLWETPCPVEPDLERCVMGVTLGISIRADQFDMSETILYATR